MRILNGAVCLFLLLVVLCPSAGWGETLYNGIVLPAVWPPEREVLTREVMRVPYLEAPPAVILIDVGRQLFVDDFLIEATTMRRRFHLPESHPANPVIRPDEAWERFALPYSGGVWFDAADKLFKIWYCPGPGEKDGKPFRWGPMSLATSVDGVTWAKPDLGAGTNIVLPINRDSSTVWLDHDAADVNERFRYFATEHLGTREDGDEIWGLAYRMSGDGIQWSEPIAQQEIWGDRTTVFHNPFRDVWVVSQRTEGPGEDPTTIGRSRAYLEAPTARGLMEEMTYNAFEEVTGKSVLWMGADKYDLRHPWVESNAPAELYNLDAAPYESLMVGYFSIYQGNPRHKNFVQLGFSRDGFHWWRPDRRPFLYDERGEGWILEHRGDGEEPGVQQILANIQAAAGGSAVVGDKLHFYAMSRANRGTNLYTLRRDGFASMEAGEESATLTTRLVTFSGKHLFVNADCPEGVLRVEVLGEDGEVIPPFSLKNCEPIWMDGTRIRVSWDEVDLGYLAGKPVRFRFRLRAGSLYSFWVSTTESGESNGYMGAGGPGFIRGRDLLGQVESR